MRELVEQVSGSHVPDPNVGTFVWTTGQQVLVVRTPGEVKDSVGMAFEQVTALDLQRDGIHVPNYDCCVLGSSGKTSSVVGKATETNLFTVIPKNLFRFTRKLVPTEEMLVSIPRLEEE